VSGEQLSRTPLKVALISPYTLADCPAIAPGRQRPTPWTRNLALALARRNDCEVHVVAGIPPHCRGVPRQADDAGVRVHCFRTSGRFSTRLEYRWESGRVRRILRMIRPDLVHGQGLEGHAGLAALRSGYPAVVTIHGIVNRIFKGDDAYGTARRLELAGLEQLRHLIALNEYTLRQVAELRRDGLAGVQTFTIPNAVHPGLFELPALRSDGSEITLLFSGVLRKRKGLLDLLRALVLLKARGLRPRLLVAGIPPGGGDEYQTEVARTIDDELPGQVEWLGFVDPEQMPRVYSRADLVALPSYQETAPMVVAEGLAAGRPVIATTVGGVGEMIADGVNGYLVQPGEVEQLADRIQTLVRDEEQRRQFGRAARDYAEVTHHPEVVATKTVAVYRKIVEG